MMAALVATGVSVVNKGAAKADTKQAKVEKSLVQTTQTVVQQQNILLESGEGYTKNISELQGNNPDLQKYFLDDIRMEASDDTAAIQLQDNEYDLTLQVVLKNGQVESVECSSYFKDCPTVSSF